jgi:hypothetical protein
MADHSVTISNTLQVLGGGEPSLWNEMVWGEDCWGSTKDLQLQIEKCLGNTTAITTGVEVQLVKVIANTLSFTSAGCPLALQDGAGNWDYIFEGGVTNPKNRASTSYSEDSDAGTSYSEVNAPDTSWSDA